MIPYAIMTAMTGLHIRRLGYGLIMALWMILCENGRIAWIGQCLQINKEVAGKKILYFLFVI